MDPQSIIFEVDRAQIEEVVRRVLREVQSSCSEPSRSDPEIEMVKQRLDRIMAKDFITLNEAAFLLSCSDGHIRNLIKKAHNGEAERPIPIRDLDGLFVFNLEELLAWSREVKSKNYKERKASLRDVSVKVS